MLFSQRYHRALLERRLSVDLPGEARMPKLEGKERDTVLNYLEATFPPRAPATGGGWQNPFLNR